MSTSSYELRKSERMKKLSLLQHSCLLPRHVRQRRSQRRLRRGGAGVEGVSEL
ncbi:MULTISPECIES: hypothetical protein [Fischerella]|uniref:hypothetical protein n=1 Tax=Fischerella TaxID=1190 RepID=UPI0012F7B657|nr:MULTISPECIES: hypothetical protein [Fischerella]MBD2430301.1 hypothetical protein [Fischerella sp. FACHB-380]